MNLLWPIKHWLAVRRDNELILRGKTCATHRMRSLGWPDEAIQESYEEFPEDWIEEFRLIGEE
jgi:hypothetical protein